MIEPDAEAAGVAARLIATLRPRRVHVTGGEALAQALLAAGVDLSEVPERADLTIALAAADPFGPGGERLLAAPPAGADVPAWLLRGVRAGLQPDMEYDAGFVGPRAVLFTRRSGPPGPALAGACEKLLLARADLHRRARLVEQRAERQARVQLYLQVRIAEAQDRLGLVQARLQVAEFERDAIRQSRIWRMSAPLRRVMNIGRRGRAAGVVRATGSLEPSAYEAWVRENDTLDDADREAIRVHIGQLPDCPVISVVMPVYDVTEAWLRAAIGSVRAQLYPHWQLCMADDASTLPHVARVLADVADEDTRIAWVRCERNGNISAATNAALALATGEFVALMDHDDLLPEHALYEVAVELAAHPDADLIYSDEDQIDARGRRTTPYFKPDWNIDLLLAHNMISHLGVYRRALVMQLGGMRLGYEGSQDYDLALRVVDASAPARIRHIARVLYHWRQQTTSFSKERIDACVAAARRAIRDHLDRAGQGQCATVLPAPRIASWTRVQWALPQPAPLVSVIVPTRDRAELLARCVRGVLGSTDYPRLELIIVDNDSREAGTAQLLAELALDARVRVLPYAGAFNFSAMNNAAVAVARGEVLALVNNDIEVIGPEWLTEMVGQAMRPGIGAVGARLLFGNGTVQHVGVVLGVGSFDGGPGVAGHFSLHDQASSLGYFAASQLVHEVAAVTAACMVVRRDVYLAAGGMDAAHLPVAFNDVDFCLRLRRAGLRNLFTPYAELTHHESSSRGHDLAPEHRARFDGECRTMRARWGAELDADPFYNANFSREDGLFRLSGVLRRLAPWR